MSLLIIPAELVAHIQDFLDPCDILSLRKTCRALSIATYERVLWSRALVRMCKMNGVFLPTFPLDDMPRRALERATLAPYRLLASLRSGHRIDPPVTQMLATTGSRMEFAQVCLVPGGRFLFTQDNEALVQLWDLGFGSAEGVGSSDVALASLQLKDSTAEILGFQPTCDGLRIILIMYTKGNESHGIQLYEIDPVSSMPMFELACKMTIDSVLVDDEDFVVFASSPNLIAFYHNPFVTVWDFVDNCSSTWTPTSCSNILLADDHIILINDEAGFAVWKIPPLEPVTPHNQNHTTATQTAFFTLPKTDSYFTCNIFHPHCFWPEGPSRPPYIAFTEGTPTSDNVFGFITVDVKEEDPVPRVQTVSMPAFHDNAVPLCAPSRICLDSLIQPCMDKNGRIQVYIMDFPPLSHKPLNNTVATLYKNGTDIRDFDFCPFSGRLCTVNLVSNGDHRIVVAESLALP